MQLLIKSKNSLRDTHTLTHIISPPLTHTHPNTYTRTRTHTHLVAYLSKNRVIYSSFCSRVLFSSLPFCCYSFAFFPSFSKAFFPPNFQSENASKNEGLSNQKMVLGLSQKRVPVWSLHLTEEKKMKNERKRKLRRGRNNDNNNNNKE